MRCGAVTSERGSGGSTAFTNADGLFQLIPPSPGIYNVWVERHDQGARVASTDDALFVQPGQPAMSELHLIEGRLVRGTLTDLAGKPAKQVQIGCYSHSSVRINPSYQYVATDEKGEFTFTLTPGNADFFAEDKATKSVVRALLAIPEAGEISKIELKMQSANASTGQRRAGSTPESR